MPEAAVIGQFERRLAELGCPEALARRKARELAEHHADLKEAALAEGLSEVEAGARADAQLGEAATLAESLAGVMRQSSWWGRHPLIGFCLLPPFTFFLFWALCGAVLVGVVWLLGHLLGPNYLVNMDTVHGLAQEPDEFMDYARPLIKFLNAGASAMWAGLFCWLAGRAVCGLKWMMSVCAVCSLSGVISWVSIAPLSGQHNSFNLTLGYSSSPNWICASIPWLVAAVALVHYRRRLGRLPTLPRQAAVPGAKPQISSGVLESRGPKRSRLKNILMTPTYWITAFVLGALVAGLVAVRQENLQERAAPIKQAPPPQAAE